MTISPWAVHRAVLLLHATSILIIVRAVGAFLPSSAIIGIVPRDYIIPIRGGNTNLQGIKGFRSWFENAFPSAVVTINPDRRDGDGNGSAEFQPETFDHVLIDANQFLHTTLRRAYNRRATRSSDIGRLHLDDDVIEYSLLLFIKEINRITSTTAIPRKSLVIAIDGSPGAAKLDRQRRRRYSIHKKAESQERQIGILRDRGWMDVDFGFSSSSSSSNASANNRGKRNRGSNDPVLRKHDRERVTLNITPGTAFMDMVTNALLYWAWQHVARYPRVRVYISPSSVHGEGEVKLLDWMTFGHRMGGGGGPSSMASSSSSSSPTTVDQRRHRTNVKRNDTVAILGGDSDLVLMGLVVPPSITHNIHVILPGEKGESLVASIWETTRIMAGMIEGTSTYGSRRRNGRANTIRRKRSLTLNQINQVRIDTTLLIILNGNDYLPKVKGCRAGFDSFFPVYLDLVKSWMDGRQGGNDDEDSFLINLDGNGELQMNVRFAMKFFRALASSAETVPSFHDMNKDNSSSSSQSHLGHLNNLVDAKIFPGPITFNTIRPQDSFFRRELWEMNSKLKQNTTRLMSEVFGDDEVEIVRLTIGHIPDDYVPSSDERTSAGSGGEEIFTTFRGGSDGHGVISRMMRSGNTTATGKGRAYLFEVPHRQQSSMKSTKERLSSLALEEIFGRENMDTLFEENDSNDGDERDMEATDSGSFSEKQGLAKSDAASYLGGLLWNLETYLHGCCVDYGYDYGSRASPTPSEIVEYLESIDMQGTLKICCADLTGRISTAPISDGLSCLACLPPQAYHIVPEPYSWLVEPSRKERFEDLYNSCFHPETRAFDIESFSRKCYAELSKIERTEKAPVPSQSSKGRRIQVGSNFWTVISRSNLPLADPFEPPEPYSDRIPRLRRNSRIKATKLPAKSHIERSRDTTITDLPNHEENSTRIQESVHDIPYKTAFKLSIPK